MAQTSSTWTSALLDLLFEDANTGRCLVAPDGSVLRANGEWLRSTGFPLDDVLGANIIDLFPETRDMALALHARARTGHRVEVPLHAQHLGGREIWWTGAIEPVPMEGGVGLLITARESSRNLLEVHEAGRAIQEVADASQDGLVALDRRWCFTFVNSRGAKNAGFAREDMLGRNIWEMFPSLRGTAHEAAHRRVMQDRVPTTVDVQGVLDGKWYRLGIALTSQGIAVVWTDVTDHYRAEESLRESEARFRALANGTPVPIWVNDATGRVEFVNRAYEEFFGVSAEAVRSDGWQPLVHPDDASAYVEAFRASLSARAPFRARARVRRADGEWRWIDSHGAPRFTFDGEFVGMAGSSPDITEQRLAMSALEEQLATKDQLARVAASVPGVIYSYRMRPDGTAFFPFAGPGFEELFGLPARSLARDSAPWAERIHSEDLQPVIDAVASSARTMSRWHEEFRYLHPVKGLRWVEGWSLPGAEPDGSVTWHGYVKDVTDTKRGEEARRDAEKRYETMFYRSPIAKAWTKLPEGSIADVNDEWVQLMGISREEASGRNTVELGIADLDDRTRFLEDVREHGAAEAEMTLRTRAGIRTVFTRAELVTLAGEQYVLGAMLDISARKEAEAALRESDRRKSEFLAVLSHELRNPLAPIRNSLALLDRAPPGGEVDRRARAVLNRQTGHLARLVDDLLDATRLAYGKIELKLTRLDAREVVRRACHDAGSEFEQRGIRLECTEGAEPAWVEADEARLAQIVGNLLHNALKFTPSGRRVHVATRRQGTACEVRIRDEGMGVGPEDLERIFEPFEQSKQTHRHVHGGLGIGLALVRQLVTQHGGTVRASSDGEGKGAEFVVTLPLAAALVQEPTRTGPSVSGLSIVVVEDNEDAGATLADVLELDGHEVVVAGTGRAGVELVSSRRPDVLLCDVGLPDLNGHEVIRAIRAGPAGHRVFAIALTGYAQAHDREQAMAAGFDAHLPKPPDLGRLAALLAEAAKRKR